MIVVTGAHGFIGSRLLLALLKRHSAGDLLSVDHPASPRQKNQHVASNVPFMDHVEFLSRLAAGEVVPEIILHMGACSDTTMSDWGYLLENNVHYSQTLWNWCARNQKRLLYASSAATYGDGQNGFNDESDLRVLRPLNLYGRSKHEFDLWAEQERQKHRALPAQAVGFKFFNVYGPGEGHKGRMASMVFHAFHQIQCSGKVKLFKSHHPDYEDGGQLRDFIYVDQVTDVIFKCIDAPGVSGLFNVGTGHARSFRDLAEAVFLAFGKTPQIEYIPMPLDLREKYQYFTEATMRKAVRSGIEPPSRSLEDSVSAYISWLKSVDNPVMPAPAPKGSAPAEACIVQR
jgi:ADP-L-glycero-D-manno-heptose 6-epimerase